MDLFWNEANAGRTTMSGWSVFKLRIWSSFMLWFSPQLLLNNGALISILVSFNSGDIEKILIDKSLAGKIPDHISQGTHFFNSCMYLIDLSFRLQTASLRLVITSVEKSGMSVNVFDSYCEVCCTLIDESSLECQKS